MQILITILGGAIGAAVVSGIFGVIMWKLNRKASKEDKAEEKEEKSEAERDAEIEEIRRQLNSLIVSQRTILYDRIKHLANSYIKRGTITSEELEDLISMHSVYHTTLCGNGFLDSLMEKVHALPVKG